MFRDKRYEVTLNHEGEQVEKKTYGKDIKQKAKPDYSDAIQNIG